MGTIADRLVRLPFGVSGVIAIDPPAKASFWRWAPRGAAPLDDPVAAVAAALADPIEFPQLASAVAPGDRVAIALQAHVPHAAAIVAGMVHTLIEAEAPCESITVVCQPPDSANEAHLPDPLRLLTSSQRAKVTIAWHDPADRAMLSYLAASRDARPIYFNRLVLDADLVLPIGLTRPSALGEVNAAGLFPAFSDLETQARYREGAALTEKSRRRLEAEADEAVWLLGAQFQLQATPGPGDSLLQAHAGERHAAMTKAQALCDAVWEYEAPASAKLVIAAIDGGPEQQTWLAFARALRAALAVADEDAVIVLCTELDCTPGVALRLLAHPGGREAAARDLKRQKSSDAWPAHVLHEALGQAQIYLLSRLPQEAIEELGMAHVESPEEVARLARSALSVAVIESAQHAAPRVL